MAAANANLANLRIELRALLDPAAAAALWTDAALNMDIWGAVADHSHIFPRQATVTITTLAGTLDYDILPAIAAGTVGTNVDLLGIQAIELPAGTPIAREDWDSTTGRESRASANASTQGYRWRQTSLRLRRAPVGAEIGANLMRLDVIQTWGIPDPAGTTLWDAPIGDKPLLHLLAKRAAYEQLQEWQIFTQGYAATPTITKVLTNVTIDIPPILEALEIQIQRAIDLRRLRTTTYKQYQL